MAKTNRYTAQQMIDALKATRGLVYLAAKALGCDPDTVQSYCKRFPTVERAKHDARGTLLDVAEERLWQAVQRGDAWAITFALKTLGKGRGYVERQELAHEGQVNLASAPEWVRVRSTILAALAPYPQARLRLAAVLSDAEPPMQESPNGTSNGLGH